MQETTLSGESMNIVTDNIGKLKQIFPDVFTEDKVDFEKLQQVLGNYVEEKEERFNFTWNGKSKALRLSQTPSTGTLRPYKEESESQNWNATKNIYIEGDNLEVLKLLQKTYHRQIKMIYIDPPYNTGGDFVYADDFKDNLQNYLEITGQKNSEGNKLSANSESNGRYHTNWLNMMYPRLRLARNLLKDDGLIFISIDDNEVDNLKKICNEIFGEDNFIANLIWQNKKGGGNDSSYIAIEHEYILVYAKNTNALGEFYELYTEEYLKRYKEEDEISKFYWDTFKRKSGKQYYPITCPDGSVLQYDIDGNQISWLRSEPRFLSDKEIGDIRFLEVPDGWSVQFKQRLPQGKKPRSIFTTEDVISNYGTTSSGSTDVYQYFKKDVFSNPKPVELVSFLLGFGLQDNEYVLDFFSGSATIAESVMQCNKNDDGNRRYIAVQLQENLDEILEKTPAGKKITIENAISILDEIEKSHTIPEIAKERIRRAGDKIKKEIEQENMQLKLDGEPKKVPDIGFKVFKLDSSNIEKWNPDYDKLEESIQQSVLNFKAGRGELDMVYEIMLKYGVDLTHPIQEIDVNGKKLYSIGYGALVICLDNAITVEIAEAIVKHKKEINPETNMVVVFKDNGFNDDSAKTNIKETLKVADIKDFVTI